MTKKILIPKYPYLGYSPNLIEFFGIIGYQEEFVPNLIKEASKNINQYPPTILNAVISNIDYGTVDYNIMLSQIYPENPLIIIENYYNIMPPPSSVIYSFCFDSQDGKKKLIYTCYAYKFHEAYKNQTNNETYFIPKAFALISQYSFFNTFHYICKNIEKIIHLNNKNSLPLELIIYSLLNYLPTPMNFSICLNVFDLIIKTEQLKLEQISGYPYIDFNLEEIFDIIPSYLFIEIYLISFLEQKILFFSQNLEILNLIMYIIFSLNYPCNDSNYFWHIVSFSPKNLTVDNKFVAKTQNSLLGVNATYTEEIDTTAFGSYHFIMDIDNKKFFLKSNEEILQEDEENEVKELQMLQEYIQYCIKDKNVESFFLKKFIIELKNNLDNILSKEIYFYGKNIEFFNVTPKIKETNKKIQEIFYNFNLNIMMIFHNDNEINSSYDKIEIKEDSIYKGLQFKGKTIILCENEKLFCNFFRDSIKYKIYYENFIQNFDSMDIFKIPLLFCEEFINLKLKEYNNILSNISFFNIIDTLYFQSIPQTININLTILYNEYNENMKKHFKHFYLYTNKPKRQLFVLDKNILNKFIYLLNNKYEKNQILKLFPSISLRTPDFIASIDQRSIKDVIINYLINIKIINNYDCIFYSVIYIFAMSLTLHSYEHILIFLAEILHCLNTIPFFSRYYINIILQTLHYYFLINEENNSFPEMSFDKIKFYFFFIANFIKQKGIIPDEEMMKYLSNFFGNKVKEKRNEKLKENIELEKIEENNDDNINDKKENKIEDDKINNEQDNDNILLKKKDNIFKIKFKYNFHYYIKHAFTFNKILSPKFIVKTCLSSSLNQTLFLKITDKISLKPIIVMKIMDYVNSSEIYLPITILQDCNFLFSDFSENFNYDLKKIDLDLFRILITNLILYGLEMIEVKIPVDFLIYTLYALKDIEIKKES